MPARAGYMRRSRYAAVVARCAQAAETPVSMPVRSEFMNSDERQLLSHSEPKISVGDLDLLVFSRATDDHPITFSVEKEEVKFATFELQISDPTTREFVCEGITRYGGSVVTEDGDFIVSDSEKPHGNVLAIEQLKFAYNAAGIRRKRRTLKVAIRDASTGATVKKSEFVSPEIMFCSSPILSGTPFRRPTENRQKPVYGSDGSRKKIVDAPDSGYCQICGERYDNKDEHRETPSHRERVESEDLWSQFDEFARGIDLSV